MIYFLLQFRGYNAGVYEITNVHLNGNLLTRLESGVYLPILEQMVNYEGNVEDRGFFEVGGSINTKSLVCLYVVSNFSLNCVDPFDCVDDPCHLTWLLRDNNRTFLQFIYNAACANGTLFEDILPDDPMFRGCH